MHIPSERLVSAFDTRLSFIRLSEISLVEKKTASESKAPEFKHFVWVSREQTAELIV